MVAALCKHCSVVTCLTVGHSAWHGRHCKKLSSAPAFLSLRPAWSGLDIEMLLMASQKDDTFVAQDGNPQLAHASNTFVAERFRMGLGAYLDS